MSATILIVDDETANRELMVELLAGNGFSILTARDGREGLLEFARARPDMVLMDVRMPHVSGFEACRRLKSNPETRLTPVVLVTSLSQVQDRVLGLDAGADDFLIRPVDRTELLARVRSLLSIKSFTDELESAEAVLFALAQSIEGKDPYTLGHCERIAEGSARLGTAIGLNAEQIKALRRAGIVHDVGKIAVPDSVLLKPGRLTAEEFKIIQEHPVLGERICAPMKSFRNVLPIIRHHHEKLNGTGYPDGLKGKDIPVTARVLQIVDVFDALTTERPYKGKMTAEAALAIMAEEVGKGWWDPQIFAVFERIAAPRLELHGAWLHSGRVASALAGA